MVPLLSDVSVRFRYFPDADTFRSTMLAHDASLFPQDIRTLFHAGWHLLCLSFQRLCHIFAGCQYSKRHFLRFRHARHFTTTDAPPFRTNLRLRLHPYSFRPPARWTRLGRRIDRNETAPSSRAGHSAGTAALSDKRMRTYHRLQRDSSAISCVRWRSRFVGRTP